MKSILTILTLTGSIVASTQAHAEEPSPCQQAIARLTIHQAESMSVIAELMNRGNDVASMSRLFKITAEGSKLADLVSKNCL